MRVGALGAFVLAVLGAGVTALAIVGVLVVLDRLERRP
jgi:hypothetical protein